MNGLDKIEEDANYDIKDMDEIELGDDEDSSKPKPSPIASASTQASTPQSATTKILRPRRT